MFLHLLSLEGERACSLASKYRMTHHLDSNLHLHKNISCVLVHGPHTKTELSFWCQREVWINVRFESTWCVTLSTYRVIHLVDSILLLTSNQQFRFGLARAGQAGPGQYGTCLLMSMGGLNQGDVSPCTWFCSCHLFPEMNARYLVKSKLYP